MSNESTPERTAYLQKRRAYYQQNKERLRALEYARRAKNPGMHNVQNRQSVARLRAADPEGYAIKDRAKVKRHRDKNKKKLQAKTLEWVDKHPGYYSWKNAQYRAKKLGLPFDLTLDDVVLPAMCPVLGIPIIAKRGAGWTNNSPSIDRLVPELGYVKSNIRVISMRANSIKRDATLGELRLIVAYLEREIGDGAS